MALRLTQTAPLATADPHPATTGPGSTAGPSEARLVARLVAEAAAQLGAGLDDGFLAAFARCAALPPQRRYQATRQLVERGLSVTSAREGRALVDLLVGLAGALVDALEFEPAEPLLLNYAGVVFYELWSLDAARHLFLAARRLDPDLPHLADNIAAVKARRQLQARRPRGRRAAPIHPALGDLGRRATHASAAAHPASGLRMSLCMIVKNEEEMLGRCLAAAAPAVDEIIVVDTGSGDRTIEIAHEYGALVLEREWTGSFSDARNASFDAATGDWILYLDADEVLVSDDVEKLRRLCTQSWREAFFVHETNFTGQAEAGVAVVHSTLRVFRNRPEYRFSGRLHEQIAHTLPLDIPERIHQSAVRVDHYGYLSSVRAAKDKSRRNVELLERQRTDGGSPSAFDLFNLGCEYMAVDRHADAVIELRAAWAQATAPGSGGSYFLPALANRLISALRQADRPEEALRFGEEALARFPDFTDLVYNQGLAALAMGRDEQIVTLLERAIAMGDPSSHYTSLVGVSTFLPRIALAEWHLGREETAEALELLRWCAEHYPTFSGVYYPYCLALLRDGRSGAEAVSEIEAALGEHANSMNRFMIATALLEGGAFADAAGQLSQVLERRPGNPQVLELLMHALLAVQDFIAFEARLADFAASDLAPREQSERLARMYLRHGFLRSAAREWMAVVDREPDAAALRGLAEVARRNGQNETAAAFASEALKCVSS